MSLETVHPEAFLGLVGLTLLSLSQNKLAHLPEKLLEPVPKLEKLFLGGKVDKDFHVFLEGNLLETFPVGFFEYTPGLRILDVSENRLQAWTKAFGALQSWSFWIFPTMPSRSCQQMPSRDSGRCANCL